jgi:mannose-1-phosphate guanylyltransferase
MGEKRKNLEYAFVLAGGKGERFWPRSRKYCPKQLLDIVDTRSMVEMTTERISPLIPKDRIFVVANQSIEKNLLQIDLKIPAQNYLFEPTGRNTAPAIGFAAFTLFQADEDSTMIVLPADHYISDKKAFLACIKEAVEIAQKGYLVTFGIVPTRPETGYGYIECGPEIGKSVCEVEKFKEKPSQKKAVEFIKQESFLWNSGIFVWRTKTIIEKFHDFQPDFAKGIERYVKLTDTKKKRDQLRKVYENAESISIDYAIMEKASKVAVVRASFGWDDVGSWSALERLVRKDENGNIAVGDVVAIDTKDSIVVGDKGVVGVLGVSNLVVVHTEDATLILPKERSQEVKDIVGRLNSLENLEKYT